MVAPVLAVRLVLLMVQLVALEEILLGVVDQIEQEPLFQLTEVMVVLVVGVAGLQLEVPTKVSVVMVA